MDAPDFEKSASIEIVTPADKAYFDQRHRRDGQTISRLIAEKQAAEKRIAELCNAHEKAWMRAELAEAELKRLKLVAEVKA